MKARPDSRAELNRIAGIDVLNGLRNVNLITFLSQLSTLKPVFSAILLSFVRKLSLAMQVRHFIPHVWERATAMSDLGL